MSASTFDDWGGQSLQHYGVLGMKWGQRRYQNEDGTLTAAGQKHYAKTGERGYQYHSHSTKKYLRKALRASDKAGQVMDKPRNSKNDKRAVKLVKKSEKYLRRAERSDELDRREQTAAEKAKIGRSLLVRALINPDVTKAYHQYNAMSGGKPGKATKAVNAIMAAYGGTMMSRIYKAAYLRQGEKASGKGFANRLTENKQALDSKLAKADKVVDSEIKKKRHQYNI